MTDLFFWNKYKPTRLSDIKHNGRSILLLQRLTASTKDIPHIFISGLSSEYTSEMARIFIREISNEEVLKFKTHSFALTPNITVNIKSSEHHYEFDMNYYKYMRRDIPLLIIDNIVRHKNISNNSYHIILIQNADLMTYNVQAAFRRMMEKYIRSCRFIFTSTRGNGIVEALRSRLFKISFNRPTFSVIRGILKTIIDDQKLEIIDESIYERIYENTEGIIDAINLLQLYTLNDKALEYKEKYSPYNELIFYIKKGDIRYFKKIQDILFVLHSLDIDHSRMIRQILNRFISDKSIPDSIKHKITTISADCDWRCSKSNRTIISLNLFIGKLIQIFSKKKSPKII